MFLVKKTMPVIPDYGCYARINLRGSVQLSYFFSNPSYNFGIEWSFTSPEDSGCWLIPCKVSCLFVFICLLNKEPELGKVAFAAFSLWLLSSCVAEPVAIIEGLFLPSKMFHCFQSAGHILYFWPPDSPASSWERTLMLRKIKGRKKRATEMKLLMASPAQWDMNLQTWEKGERQGTQGTAVHGGHKELDRDQ